MRVKTKLRIWLPLALLASALELSSSLANAAFVVIADTSAPDVASYLSATTLMTIPGPSHAAISSLSDANLTVSFNSPPLEVLKSPEWGSWANAPTPDLMPDVIWTTTSRNSVTLDLTSATPVTTFGLEAEPNSMLDSHDIKAEFFNGATSLGSVTYNVDGNGGSRLFAATLDNFGTDPTNTQQFTRVVLTSDLDFAFARVRYALEVTAVPEPGSIAMLLGAVAVGLPVLAIRRRRAKPSD